MQDDIDPIAPLIDLEQIAAGLGIPQAEARAYLEARHDPPVATYRGRPLWLAATAHDALAVPA